MRDPLSQMLKWQDFILPDKLRRAESVQLTNAMLVKYIAPRQPNTPWGLLWLMFTLCSRVAYFIILARLERLYKRTSERTTTLPEGLYRHLISPSKKSDFWKSLCEFIEVCSVALPRKYRKKVFVPAFNDLLRDLHEQKIRNQQRGMFLRSLANGLLLLRAILLVPDCLRVLFQSIAMGFLIYLLPESFRHWRHRQ